MTIGAGHPALGSLLGHDFTHDMLSPDIQLIQMRTVEDSYIRALATAGRIPENQALRIIARLADVTLDMDALRARTHQDGVVVPGLVAQMKSVLSAQDAKVFHTGLTSQDVIDTSFAMSLIPILRAFAAQLNFVRALFPVLSQKHGTNPLMGRTRHQAALPITVQHRLDEWDAPLGQLMTDLEILEPDLLSLQLGGPVGLAEGLDQEIANAMAADLGLSAPNQPWHTNRHALIRFGGWLSQVSGAMGKIGQDVALMAQQGIDEVALDSGGSSSAMPHKQNPILAETLVTLARYNATQVGGLHQALIHEQERSGVAWALEWMILPSMIEATGASLERAGELLGSFTRIGTP